MSLLFNEFKNISLNLELFESFYDEVLEKTVIRIDFKLITPHKIYSYENRSNLILWKIALESLLNDLQQLYERKVYELYFYPIDMYFIFEIIRFDTPDENTIQWTIKFPSGIYYGFKSAGYEESITFTINDFLLKEFIDSLEKELFMT